MALEKQIIDSKGQITNYHRIRGTSQNYDEGQLYINLVGYTSEQYRLVEKESTEKVETVVVSIGLVLPLIDEDFSKGHIYTRIKAEIEGWADATDC